MCRYACARVTHRIATAAMMIRSSGESASKCTADKHERIVCVWRTHARTRDPRPTLCRWSCPRRIRPARAPSSRRGLGTPLPVSSGSVREDLLHPHHRCSFVPCYFSKFVLASNVRLFFIGQVPLAIIINFSCGSGSTELLRFVLSFDSIFPGHTASFILLRRPASSVAAQSRGRPSDSALQESGVPTWRPLPLPLPCPFSAGSRPELRPEGES